MTQFNTQSLDLIEYHQTLLRDEVRISAYKKAISEVVSPGNVVVDIGSGTGILAMLACKAGAKKVYAIECSEIIEVARALAEENNLLNKIIFIKKDSKSTILPEKVDVIVSELFGFLGIAENAVEIVADAKKRFLKENGGIIPQSIKVMAVPVEAPELYKQIELPKIENLSFSALRSLSTNKIYTETITPSAYLSSPFNLVEIDLKKEDKVPLINQSFTLNKSGTLHGFVGWFEAKLSDKVTLNTSPENKPTHWETSFLPVETPIKVSAHDEVEITLSGVTFSNSFLLNWAVKFTGKSGTKQFNHSMIETIPPFLKLDLNTKKSLIKTSNSLIGLREIAKRFLKP